MFRHFLLQVDVAEIIWVIWQFCGDSIFSQLMFNGQNGGTMNGKILLQGVLLTILWRIWILDRV